MSSQPPSETPESAEAPASPESPAASAPFFDRVRDFLLGHPEHPEHPEHPGGGAEPGS